MAVAKSSRHAHNRPREPSYRYMSRNIDIADEHDDIMYPSTLPFILLHLSCVAAFWSGITWQAVAICVTLYWLRMFAITAGYHRYFSHPAYLTTPLFHFSPRFPPPAPVQNTRLGGAPHIP